MSRDRSSKIERKRAKPLRLSYAWWVPETAKWPLDLEQSKQKKEFRSEGSGHKRLCKPLLSVGINSLKLERHLRVLKNGMTCSELFKCCFSDVFLGMELLSHMVVWFLVFWEPPILFSTVTTLIYIPSNSVGGVSLFFSPHLHSHCYLCSFWC